LWANFRSEREASGDETPRRVRTESSVGIISKIFSIFAAIACFRSGTWIPRRRDPGVRG